MDFKLNLKKLSIPMSETYNTNIKFIKKGRKKPIAGDVFVYQLPDNRYGYGKVIKDDAALHSWKPFPLVYIYNTFADDIIKGVQLDKTNLLIAPLIINFSGWSSGYFINVENVPITEQDILDKHCFKEQLREGYFYDEYSKRIDPIEGCNIWGLCNYRTIDNQVSDALGIPRVVN